MHWITMNELAERRGVTRRTLEREIQAGKLPAYRTPDGRRMVWLGPVPEPIDLLSAQLVELKAAVDALSAAPISRPAPPVELDDLGDVDELDEQAAPLELVAPAPLRFPAPAPTARVAASQRDKAARLAHEAELLARVEAYLASTDTNASAFLRDVGINDRTWVSKARAGRCSGGRPRTVQRWQKVEAFLEQHAPLRLAREA